MIAVIVGILAIWVCRYAYSLLRLVAERALGYDADEYKIIAFLLLFDIFILGMMIGYGAYNAYELIFS